jgi:regulatory protein
MRKPKSNPKHASGRVSAPPPNETILTEYAIAHLARYATTRAGLARVLARRVLRWSQAAAPDDPERTAALARAAEAAIPGIVERLAASGAVDDAAFAETRARRLTQSGRSRRAVAAHLQARGVDQDALKAALGDAAAPEAEQTELAAAVATTRRRRIGAYRRAPVDAEGQRKELGALARAGFSQEVAQAALRVDPDTAEALLGRLRRL